MFKAIIALFILLAGGALIVYFLFPSLNLVTDKSGNSKGNGGFWTGLAVKVRYTDLSTGEIKEGAAQESEIGFEAPFGARIFLLGSDYNTEAKIKLEKDNKSQIFSLKKGESIEFQGIKTEIVDFVNSPCPAGATC